MESKLKRILRKIKSFSFVMSSKGSVTFSQYGEDLIMLGFISKFKVKNITYLDIGANEPIRLNNTYNLYLRGYSGVLVEPNADLCTNLKNTRSRDKVLNFGISNNNEAEADYYMFGANNSVYNTFSKESAVITENEGIPIKKIIKVQLKDINDVISENFSGSPTILSLDVEGLDEVILRKLDFDKYQPLLICVETVNFSLKNEVFKINSILDFLTSKGYFIYADTNLNTIFCSRKLLDTLVKN